MKTKHQFPLKHIKALASGAVLMLTGLWAHAANPPGVATPSVNLDSPVLLDLRIMVYVLAFIALLILYIAIVLSVKDPAQLSLKYIWDGIVGRNAADPETDHDYDGIKELDNPMPAWLRLIFIGSIAFAFVYMIYYHVTKIGPLSREEYDIEMAAAAETYKSVELPEDQLIQIMDGGRLTAAAAVFAENCATCHRTDLGGESGPNLTDEFWLHGGSVKEIYNTITNGVPGKTMISWKDRIPSQERLAIASYILSKQGSMPTNPRAPEGMKAGEESAVDSAPTAQDSVSGDTLVTQ
jgi:cytochrome c oxidase cbb3-type subunit III